MAGRYEFRIWAESLGGLKSRIEGMGRAARAESSEQIYWIAAATDSCNATIRGALIDIKILSGTHGRLEQWRPVLKSGFPIEAAIIAEQIFPRLELQAPQLSKDRYIMDEFLEVVSAIISAHWRDCVGDTRRVVADAVDACTASVQMKRRSRRF